jgi:hypothetical protein
MSRVAEGDGTTFLGLLWGPTPTTCQRSLALAPVAIGDSLLGI